MSQHDLERMISGCHKAASLGAYLTGILYAQLVMIRNDLHMGDAKAALVKVNDAIKLQDEKIVEVLYGSEKRPSE